MFFLDFQKNVKNGCLMFIVPLRCCQNLTLPNVPTFGPQKVSDFDTDRKSACDCLLMNNTNLAVITSLHTRLN